MSVASEAAKRTGRSSPATACTGKVPFDSFSQAAKVVDRTKTKPRPGRSAYRCGHCHKWHIGTDSGRVELRNAIEFKERRQAHE